MKAKEAKGLAEEWTRSRLLYEMSLPSSPLQAIPYVFLIPPLIAFLAERRSLYSRVRAWGRAPPTAA
jgi:hypothetical protein